MMRERTRMHECKSRPFGGTRRAWDHVARQCVYCGKTGPRTKVRAGHAHRRCIEERARAERVATENAEMDALARAAS